MKKKAGLYLICCCCNTEKYLTKTMSLLKQVQVLKTLNHFQAFIKRV